ELTHLKKAAVVCSRGWLLEMPTDCHATFSAEDSDRHSEIQRRNPPIRERHYTPRRVGVAAYSSSRV
ncbi:hypothetical protein ABVT39_005121, partial [Epinephelus coioides]